MRAGIDITRGSSWSAARRQVQERADVVLGEAGDYFLYRGRLYEEDAQGQPISALLSSTEGCERLLVLIERLDAEEALRAVILDDGGREPTPSARPVLKLIAGHLNHVWPNGHREPV